MVSIAKVARSLTVAAGLAVCGLTNPLHAQGRSGAKMHVPPGQAKKHVTPGDAVIVTREVLVSHGYQIVRVEKVGVTQVIYYRRGNNGRGRGLGPMERLIVKPSGDRVIFESAPPKVLVAINVRLGL